MRITSGYCVKRKDLVCGTRFGKLKQTFQMLDVSRRRSIDGITGCDVRFVHITTGYFS